VLYNGARVVEGQSAVWGGSMTNERAPRPREQPDELDLGDLSVGILEEMLADLMIVKYPGVEQVDIECLLSALAKGDLNLVTKVEADIAEKSAQWMRAILRVDD